MGGLDAHIMTPLLVLGCAVSLLTEQLVTGAPHVLVVSCLFADSSSTSNECFSTDTVLVRHLLCFGCSAISVLSSISVYMQAQGLVGARGLLPLPVTLQAIEEFISSAGIDDPATCSAGIDDSATCSAGIDDEGSLWEKSLSRGLTKCMLRFVVWKYGCSSQQRTFHRQHLSSLLQLDIAASAISLVCPHPALYAYLYLSSWSHKRIGGPFYAFQWDALLLETMLVTALLAMARSAVQVSLVLWLMKVLLFRLMLGSALVKGRGFIHLLLLGLLDLPCLPCLSTVCFAYHHHRHNHYYPHHRHNHYHLYHYHHHCCCCSIQQRPEQECGLHRDEEAGTTDHPVIALRGGGLCPIGVPCPVLWIGIPGDAWVDGGLVHCPAGLHRGYGAFRFVCPSSSPLD